MSESDAVAELRHVNALVYARPSSGSLIAERTQKLSYPASLTYSLGSTMQFIINSGTESVWGPSSYLKLKVTAAGNGVAITMIGSLFNLFSQARLYHRSGELLEQVFFSDVLSNIKLRYNTSFSDYQKLASLIGGNAVVGTPDNCGLAAGTVSNYNLPLCLLFGLFDNHSQFIPSQLLAGARIELVLNSSTASMGRTSVLETLTDLTNITPILSLDCAKVYDECAKQLLEESASVVESGLQFTYSTYFASQFQPAGGAINIDVLQSASLTEKVMVVSTVNSLADKYTFRPLNTAAAGYQYQFRIGSHYLPIYSVQDDTEAFYQSQIAFNGAYNQYSRAPAHTGVGVTRFGANSCVYATSLEKSASGVQLSGEPTNNSRLINFSAQGTEAVATVTTVFLQYVRVANCMLDSCVVDR